MAKIDIFEKKIKKSTSFNGVESKEHAKHQRKSLSTFLHSPQTNKNIKNKSKKKELLAKSSLENNDQLSNGIKLHPSLSVKLSPRSDRKKKKAASDDFTKSQDSLEFSVPSILNSTTKKKKFKISTGLRKVSKPIISSTPNPVEKQIKSNTGVIFERVQESLILSTPNDKEFSSLTMQKNRDISEKSNKKNHSIRKKKMITEQKIKVDGKQDNVSSQDFQKSFNLSTDSIKKAITAVIKLRRNNKRYQNQLFDEKIPLFLQVSCHNIPKGHQKIFRIPISNPILTSDDEVCLIVGNIQGVNNTDYDHVEYYEELLHRIGIKNINKVMTFHEFRTEYETYEQKLRLVDLYEMFLVDGRICGKVVSKCGKIFYQKRKVPTPVKMDETILKSQIEKALSKVFFHMHLKGNSHCVQFGHDKMNTDNLVENIFNIVDYLNKEFPGGFENIKGIHIYALGAKSLPIYVSMKKSNEVDVPEMISKKPKAYKTYMDELTTLPNAIVTVNPTGQVTVTTTEGEKEENIEDEETTETAITKEDENVTGTNGENNKVKGKRKRKHEDDISENVIKKKKKKGKDFKIREEDSQNEVKAKPKNVFKKKVKKNVDNIVNIKKQDNVQGINGNVKVKKEKKLKVRKS